MTRITVNDLVEAAEWLRCNEGLDGEAEVCARVAEWIDREIDRRLTDGSAKRISKALGIAKGAARKALLKTMGES